MSAYRCFETRELAVGDMAEIAFLRKSVACRVDKVTKRTIHAGGCVFKRATGMILNSRHARGVHGILGKAP